jgi:hypothetical protein
MWPAAIVGMLSGLAMRVVASTGRSSVVRGALAAATAVGGVILGDIATANYIQSQGPKARVATVDSAPAEDVASEEDGDAAPAPATPEKVDAPASNPTIGLARPQRQTDDVQTMVWLGVAALVAYGLGQGSNAGASASESATPNDGPSSTPTVDPAD